MKNNGLLDFLRVRMSMSNVYQPVVIRELLLHDGRRTKKDLARSLAEHDLAAQKYYEDVVMRWPKKTLTKHGIIRYERKGSQFYLLNYPEDGALRSEAIQLCDDKIREFLESANSRERTSKPESSMRYQVLAEAGGKCQLCGISSQIRTIDLDHIVPRSRADKHGKVRIGERMVDVNDRENMQALCFSCNRAKRAGDDTNFRRLEKLVRDRVPEIIEASGRVPIIEKLKGAALREALYEKLTEEHAELLRANEPEEVREELVDLIEVVLSLGLQYGANEQELLELVHKKRAKNGGFIEGYFYKGDR